MKPSSKRYPLSFADAERAAPAAISVFKRRRVHKGEFMGLSVLEGSFFADDPERIYVTLPVGEKLELAVENRKKSVCLAVSHPAFGALGSVPPCNSVFPAYLMERGIGVSAYCEAKSLEAGVLRIAVSLYCDNY